MNFLFLFSCHVFNQLFLFLILLFIMNCRENYGCEVVCFTADVGQV